MKNASLIVLLGFSILGFSQKKEKIKKTTIKPKTEFVAELMAKMTIEEKIGQLNLPTSGDITTGQANSSNVAKNIEEGKVGGLFNIKSVKKNQRSSENRSRKKPLENSITFWNGCYSWL